MLICVLASLAVRKELVAIALNDSIVPRQSGRTHWFLTATGSKLCTLLAAAARPLPTGSSGILATLSDILA